MFAKLIYTLIVSGFVVVGVLLYMDHSGVALRFVNYLFVGLVVLVVLPKKHAKD